MDYGKYAFVISAPNRQEVLLALDREKTPKELVKEIGKQDSNISRSLKELEAEGIIKCLTPNNKRGRIYVATAFGKEIRERLLSKPAPETKHGK
ncbi:MAG: hypothetical protein RIQ56_382 [Candidatus Parcubacteria bacterium]|jgi:DNA-binding MarR family transcriptional regulator